MTKTIAIIPARKNSKRLPGKNRKSLNGKMLMDYTVEVAMKCEFIDEVVVITDDPWIQGYYLGYRDITIIDEPEEIAQDDSEAWGVVRFAIERIGQQFDNPNVIYLQPTSPLRTSIDMLNAWDMYRKIDSPIASIVYVNKWNYKLNGAIYISPYSWIIKSLSLWKHVHHFYKMPKERSINIDTQEDWNEAKRLLKL